jgi:hypothetical protein
MAYRDGIRRFLLSHNRAQTRSFKINAVEANLHGAKMTEVREPFDATGGEHARLHKKALSRIPAIRTGSLALFLTGSKDDWTYRCCFRS